MVSNRHSQKSNDLQPCFQIIQVHPRPTVGQNLQIFAPQNVGDTDRAPLICIIKLQHILASWQRSCRAAFFGVED